MAESLEKIHIPASVDSVDELGIYVGEGKLREITVEEGNPSFVSVDGVLFTKDMTELILYPCNSRRRVYRIPGSVKVIRDSAFSYAKYLHRVEIPPFIERMQSGAFSFCPRI